MATIMVVDDHASNRDYLATLLDYRGHRLLAVSDGWEALQLARTERPDLIISDILMPMMDGYEFVRRLRADPVIGQTRVIFSTAHYLNREADELAKACGVPFILTKPCEPETVFEAVDAALGLTEAPAAPVQAEAFDREHLRLLTDKLSEKAAELEAVNRKMAALMELGQQLVSDQDPLRLLEEYCRAAREIIGASYAVVGVLNENRQTLRYFYISGLDDQAAKDRAWPSPYQGVLDALLKEGRPCRLYQPKGDPQTLGLPPGLPSLHSFLGIPIGFQARVYGWLCLANKRGADQFSATDERLAVMLAAQMAVAYEDARLYSEAQHHTAELEAEIAERKRVEAALLQAQKMEAVGQLTGGVAHDFNNLLTVIMGNLQLLERHIKGDPHLGKLTQTARQAAAQGAELIRKLLAFSRRQALRPQEIDFDQLIADMAELLRRTLGEDIEIKIVRSDKLEKALADPTQLETALLNLVVNARDAMPQGGKLTIETANVTLDEEYASRHVEVVPGAYIMLAISDTGTGMSAEVASRVFEPFFTTKELGRGSGLGLSMVYGFAKQSGGHIKIYSEPGHGTTVRLYLPRAGDIRAPAVAERPLGHKRLGGDETMLVVEDNKGVRELATRFLTELGYRVLEATDGPAALALLEQDRPIQLLFTDLVLPGGMNGAELAQEAQRRRPGLKVLYTSGYPKNTITHQGRLDPGVHLLSKPYQQEELAQAVRSVLDENQGSADKGR